MQTSQRFGPNRAPAHRHRPSPSILALMFVIVALALLVVTPVLISQRLRHVRTPLLNPAMQARQQLSDFLIGFTEHLIVTEQPTWNPASARRNALAVTTVLRSLRALDTLIPPLGPHAAEHLNELREATEDFELSDEAKSLATRPSIASERAAKQRVLDAADALYHDVVAASNRGRRAVQRLERIDMFLSAGLATVALAAMIVVLALHRNVRRYAQEADARAEDLARSVSLRATLIQGVAHDVKNPLGAAHGYAQLLEERISGPLTEKQQHVVGRLKSLLVAAQQTVDEFVELARVQSTEYQLDCYEVNIASMIREFVESYQAAAKRRGIQLSCETADVIRINTDPRQVRHVIENLLSNALKFTPAGGAVRVELQARPSPRNPERVAISVSDSGPGIPVESRDRIFDPFYRVPGTEKIPGSGLGLAISRQIAQLLGGRLVVDDTRHSGARLTLSLPATGPRLSTRPTSPIRRSPAAARRNSRRIRASERDATR